jgi:L-ascorbate metabolism protein UlaG (beta-lactamase superfamily)
VRLKRGRPDLRRYADRFAVASAADDAPLAVTFLGVSTLLFDDGSSALLTDGFFTRPGLLSVLARPIGPDRDLIAACLQRAAPSRLAAVVPVHTHFDHVLDSPTVAEQTGAVLVGGGSAANVARGHGLPERQTRVAAPGQVHSLGAYDVTLVPSAHCPPDRYPGTIDTPVPRRARATAYRCGEAWSVRVHHRPSGRSVLVQGSAGFVPHALDLWQVDVAYLGVGQLGVQPESYLRDYWHHTVRAVGARHVVLIHWDDFFHPLDQPLRALPYAGDDLDVTLHVLGQEAQADGIALDLPAVWRREDPWSDAKPGPR